MEINPKSHAQTKRRKFQSRRDYRYGGKTGGHSTVKQYWAHMDGRRHVGDGREKTPDSEIYRSFRNMHGRKAQLMREVGMKLPFEQELGIDMGTPPWAKLSLDKKRRWETIPEALEKMNLAAKSEYTEYASNYEVYGVKDDWTIDELVRAREYQEKIDETFKPTWVKDRHYYAMQKRYNEKQQSSAESWPKHLMKYDRLKPSIHSGGIVCGNCRWHNCHPWGTQFTDKYLQAEFSSPVRIVAIGTKGEKCWHTSGRGYVKQYRIQYKNGGDYIGITKIFQANRDIDTEVTNNIEDPSTGKLGLEVTGIRIIPVNKPKHGYHLVKAMRVALYGEYLEEDVVEQPGDGGLRQDKFEGTVVTLEKMDSKKKKEFPRKTKSPQWSPEWKYSKPRNRREHEDAMIVASGGYNIFKGVPELAI